MKIMNNIKFLSVDYDPFKGVNPSFDILGQVADGKIQSILALAWACCFLYAAICFIHGLSRLSNGRRVGDSELFAAGRKEVGLAAIGLVGLSLAEPIYVALVK